MSIREEINRKILAYEDAMSLLGEHEGAARAILNYVRKEMLEVLANADRAPLRKEAA